MVCDGDFGIEDDISKKSLLPCPRKMNQNHCIIAAASTSSSRYRGVSTTGRFRLPISSSNFSYAFFFFMFACSCLLMSDAVSAERSNEPPKYEYLSPNDYKNDAVKKCTTDCNVDPELLRNVTLEEIKSQFLQKLGFTNGIPNVSYSLSQSEIPPLNMLSLNINKSSQNIRHPHSQSTMGPILGPANFQNDENRFDELDEGIKTHTVVARAKEGDINLTGVTLSKNEKILHDTEFVNPFSQLPRRPLLFTFESLSKNSVTNARLLLFQKAIKRDHHFPRSIKLTVYKLSPKGVTISFKAFDYNFSEHARWVDFELGKEFAKGFGDYNDSQSLHLYIALTARLPNNDSRELPLVIDVKKCDNRRPTEPDCTNVPYLQLEIEDSKNRRNKRSANSECTQDKDNSTKCCRYSLEVDFEKFKWDFVIAPKKYQAHYCAGECTLLSQQKFTHTHLASRVDSKITPCCGPRSMASIAMLYYNTNNNIVYGVLPGMIVERCGCQ